MLTEQYSRYLKFVISVISDIYIHWGNQSTKTSSKYALKQWHKMFWLQSITTISPGVTCMLIWKVGTRSRVKEMSNCVTKKRERTQRWCIANFVNLLINVNHFLHGKLLHTVDSLWLSDAISRHISESGLAQVIYCCLTARIYLIQCWLSKRKALWQSLEKKPHNVSPWYHFA